MSSLEIHQAETLHTTQDIVSHASIACRYGVFIGDLLLVNDHRFKVFKLKQDHIPHSLVMYDKDTAKTSDEAQTCEGWYRYALTNGYFQTLEEVFPKHFWNYDFDVYDFEYEILGLTERLDSLDLVNALDSEVTAAFVAQLQSGGDAFALVQEKVAAEALLRIAADNDVSSNLINGASSSGNTLKLLEDRLVTEEAKFSDSDVTNAIQVVQTDVDDNEQAADTDRALIRTQYLQADTDLIDGASSSGNTLKLLEDRVATQEGTWNNSQVTSQISSATAALVESAPATLSTLNDLAAALNDDESFSTTVSNQIGLKQDSSSHLTSVVTAARTVQQLQSLDTTTSLVAHLLLKAADSEVVHLTGAETIAGVKNFSDQITGSVSGSSGTVLSLTGASLINTLSDSSTYLRMIPAERTKVAYVDIGKAVSSLDQDDIGDGTSYKRLSAAKKTLLDSVTDAGSGVIVSASERVKIAYVDIGKNVSTLDQDDIDDGTSYKRLSAAKKTLLDGLSDVGSGTVISSAERAKVAYVDIGKAVSSLDQDDISDGTSYKRLSAAKKTLLDSVTNAGSGVIVSASERAKIAYVDIGKAVSSLDQDDIADGTS